MDKQYMSIEEIKQSLCELNTLTDRLNFWNEITGNLSINEVKENYCLRNLNVTPPEPKYIFPVFTKNISPPVNDIYYYTMYTRYHIPEYLYNEYFKNSIDKNKKEFAEYEMSISEKVKFDELLQSLKSKIKSGERKAIFDSELVKINSVLSELEETVNKWNGVSSNIRKYSHDTNWKLYLLRTGKYMNDDNYFINKAWHLGELKAEYITFKQYLENNYKYTYESWLNDEIKEMYFQGKIINNWGATLLSKGLMEKSEYEKIKQSQIEAFDICVEMGYQSEIKILQESINKSPDVCKLIEIELKETEKILESNKSEYHQILSGNKNYHGITGAEFNTILQKYKEFINGQLTHSFNYLNENQKVATIYKYHEYLINFTNNKKEPLPIKPELEKYLNEITDIFIEEKCIKMSEKEYFTNLLYSPDNKVNWIGSNPKLAASFKFLTGKEATPSEIKKWFKPKYKYTSSAKSEKKDSGFSNFLEKELKKIKANHNAEKKV